jgi:hypothetical protein
MWIDCLHKQDITCPLPYDQLVELQRFAAQRPSATALLPATPTAETHIRIALMNRFNAAGTDEIVRVA